MFGRQRGIASPGLFLLRSTACARSYLNSPAVALISINESFEYQTIKRRHVPCWCDVKRGRFRRGGSVKGWYVEFPLDVCFRQINRPLTLQLGVTPHGRQRESAHGEPNGRIS